MRIAHILITHLMSFLVSTIVDILKQHENTKKTCHLYESKDSMARNVLYGHAIFANINVTTFIIRCMKSSI